MSSKQPSKTEHVVLEAYYQSEVRGAGALKPTNIELGRKLGVTPDAIAHAKRRLKNRRYLSESDEVTSDGLQYLRHEVEVIPTEIPLVGEVRAGKARDGDLVVNMVHRSEFLRP